MIYFVFHYCDKKKRPKLTLEEQSLFYVQSIMKGPQGRNVEVGTEAKNIEEYYFLACFL